jgi:Flp pilus assembly CpaE family ATPase
MPDELLDEMVRDHPFNADEIQFLLELYTDVVDDMVVDLENEQAAFHEQLKQKANIFLIDLRGAADG